MKSKKFLQVAAICFCATTMFLCSGNLFAGTLIYEDSFELGEGSPAYNGGDSTSIIGSNGWTAVSNGNQAYVDALRRELVPTDGDYSLRFSRVSGSTDTHVAIMNEVVSEPITDGTVELWVDMRSYSFCDFFLAGPSSDIDYTNGYAGIGPFFGINGAGGAFRVMEDDGAGGYNAFFAGTSSYELFYTFHAVVDLETNTYSLEILDQATGNTVVGFDAWVDDSNSHDMGDYDAFAFRDADVTSFQAIGMRNFNGGSTSSLWLDNIKIEYTAVPEPGTVAMLLAGLITFGVAIRKRR